MVETKVAIIQGSTGVIKKWVRVLSANKPASTIIKKKFLLTLSKMDNY